MNIKDPSRVLDEISQEQIPPDLNLLPGILAKIQQGNQTIMKTTTRLRFAALLLVIVLLITFFSQPDAASALKKLIGYIPGVGTVDQSAPLRVLANPVTDTRAGYTLTVESAVLDPTRTVLNYYISGQFPTLDDPGLKPRECQEPAILRLSDGKDLAYSRSSGGFGDGKFLWQSVFPAVPAAENRVTLVLPCLPELPVDDGPQNWEIPLAFVPAPPEMTVYPVVDLPTPLPAETRGSVSANGVQFSLQGTAALEEGYYLNTLLTWQPDPAFYEVQIYPDSVHLFDAVGQEVPVWLTDQDPPFAPAEHQSMTLNLQTGPILVSGAAKLVVDYVGMSLFASTTFTFDAGDNPQPGQIWQINKELDVNGYSLKVLSAEYIQTPPGEPAMLMVYLAADSDILVVTATDLEHEVLDTGGSPNSEYVPFRVGWHYKDGFPQGKITVGITSITIRRTGPWNATWMPVTPAAAPTIQAPKMPTEQAICPDEIDLKAAPGDLPAGMGGRVASSEFTGERNELFVSNLDGSDRVPLGYGAYPDLSPDGKRVVYSGLDDGLHIRNLANGIDFLIPGTIQEHIYDTWPKWSPDGGQIAFDRVSNFVSDIYLVNPDGSNLHAVVSGIEDERFLGWAQDSSRIFYTVSEPDGQSIRVLDLHTGSSFEAGRLPPGAIHASLSPDGKRLLYTNEQGMLLMPLGSTQASLLAASTSIFGLQIHPIWSPDSQWIGMNYWEPGPDPTPRVALLQPDTCQVVLPRAQKSNWLSSWLP